MAASPYQVREPSKSLDIGPLTRAVDRSREGYERHMHEPADEQLRDGLIQRFEFTYELTHKMLRRYLRMISPTPDEFDQMPFQDLIRTGNERGLYPTSPSKSTFWTPQRSSQRSERAFRPIGSPWLFKSRKASATPIP